MKLIRLTLCGLLVCSCFVWCAPTGNRPDSGSFTIIEQVFQAIWSKKYLVAKQLMQANVITDINETKNEQTLLNTLAKQTNPSISLVTLLLKKGIQVDYSSSYSIQRSYGSAGYSYNFWGHVDNPFSTIIIEIEMPIITAAKNNNKRCVKKLYKRGAYPPSENQQKNLSDTANDLLARYEPRAQKRILLIHSWLAPQLQYCNDLEELVRSMEISPKEEGKKYYWSIASDSAMPRTTAEAGPPIGTGNANTVSS